MNQNETIALFRQGKDAWNTWAKARLAERKAMDADGRWLAEPGDFGDPRPQNDETGAWIEEAAADFSAVRFVTRALAHAEEPQGKEQHVPDAPLVKSMVVEAERIDFTAWIFPGEAQFVETEFHGHADFNKAQFHGKAKFWDAQFHRDAEFRDAQFHSDARFSAVQFHGGAWFGEAQFHGEAWFGEAQFHGDAGFERAHFQSLVGFGEAQFLRGTGFWDVRFGGDAEFSGAQFHGGAQFARAQFHGRAWFREAQFHGDAAFNEAQIHGGARFSKTQFHDDARFVEAQFHGVAGFGEAQFHGRAEFRGARFRLKAMFQLVGFKMFATFARAHFEGPADFNAIRGERAFDLADAIFHVVPDFIQAHFDEAPRLDSVRVEPRMLDGPPAGATFLERCKTYLPRWRRGAWRRCPVSLSGESDLGDIPARWLALKRLAVQAHDQDREHDFFAREIRSARFVTDWPLPLARPIFSSRILKLLNVLPLIPWSCNAWLGCSRFWFGKLYGLTSNYGRSVLLPFVWWCAGVAVATMFYLGEHQGMHANRKIARVWGAWAPSAYAQTTWDAWKWGRPCYTPISPQPNPVRGSVDTDRATSKVEIIELSAQLRNETNAFVEARQLALRDGFLILSGDADTAHRTYGCLYGIELYSNSTPVAIVPPSVGLFSGFHKLYSAVMIFLFGLALRNMLKMK